MEIHYDYVHEGPAMWWKFWKRLSKKKENDLCQRLKVSR